MTTKGKNDCQKKELFGTQHSKMLTCFVHHTSILYKYGPSLKFILPFKHRCAWKETILFTEENIFIEG